MGPWTAAAPIYFNVLLANLLYWMPQKESFYLDDEILATHPLAYSAFWVYNILIFFWMKFILLWTIRKRGPGVLVTYTIQSWTMIATRHGLSALAPFLPRQHVLLWVNEMLRFPALATASITFVYWNFIIAPVIYYNIGTVEKKKWFIQFSKFIMLILAVCLPFVDTNVPNRNITRLQLQDDSSACFQHHIRYTEHCYWKFA